MWPSRLLTATAVLAALFTGYARLLIGPDYVIMNCISTFTLATCACWNQYMDARPAIRAGTDEHNPLYALLHIAESD